MEKDTRVAKCKCGSYSLIASVEYLQSKFGKECLNDFAKYAKKGYEVFDTTRADAVENYGKECTCSKNKQTKSTEQTTLF